MMNISTNLLNRRTYIRPHFLPHSTVNENVESQIYKLQFEFLKGHELVTEESYSSDTSLIHDVIENPILPGT
jgi:hypothetical protein